MTAAELRVVNSNSFGDVATKLGVSARGANARFDSDSNDSVPAAPTHRTNRLFSQCDEDTRMSYYSTQSVDSVHTVTGHDSFESETEMNLSGPSATNINSLRTNTSLLNVSPIGSTERVGHSTYSNETGLSSPGPSTANDNSARSNASNHSTFDSVEKRRRNPRDLQLENVQQFSENLLQQKQGTVLQNQYWQVQAEKASVTKNHEMLKMKVTEINIEMATIEKQKAAQLMEIDVEKHAKLAQIEIDKQNALAQMELEAKRKQLGL